MVDLLNIGSNVRPSLMPRMHHFCFAIAGFPNVIGCVDCTHVKIISPAINEHGYINRKGFCSHNNVCGLICSSHVNVRTCL